MSNGGKKTFNIGGIRDKVKSARDVEVDLEKMYQNSFSWQAISHAAGNSPDAERGGQNLSAEGLNFSGKVLRGGKYAGEKLNNAVFSGADLKEVDFTKAELQSADFSGADLSGADLSGANLNGAVFSGARLRGTNFTGAKMNGVLLVDADIQDAILLDVEMDQLAIEELQALVEYLAIYYPHKINLTRMNLTLLDFSRIDLSQLDLRGVDFTGVDFTGINVFELDLSECIITPEQIAQALGRVPTPLELKRILAPKNKKKTKLRGIDFTAFFDSRGTAGVWDLTKHPGITVGQLLKMGKQIYGAVIKKPDPKDEEILAKFHQNHEEKQDLQAKEHNDEMRKIIEQRKRNLLNQNAAAEDKPAREADIQDYEAYEKSRQQQREHDLKLAREKYLQKRKTVSNAVMPDRSRGGYQR